MPNNRFTFQGNLAFSRGIREATDIETIKAMIPGCIHVEKTGEDKDRSHIDYEAELRGGAIINIDAKARQQGCSIFWKCLATKKQARYCNCDCCRLGGRPDIALERWSVIPDLLLNRVGVVGWTLNEASNTDLTLHSFHPNDSNECYLLPFHHLRIAFRRRFKDWLYEWNAGQPSVQDTVDEKTGDLLWQSECIFVPAPTVLNEIIYVSKGQIQWQP